MKFRKITSHSLAHILEIEMAVYAFPWTEGIFKDCLRHAHYYNYLLEDKEQIVGYCIFSIQAGECHLLNLCVDNVFRSQGYGSKLLDFVVQTATEKKASHILLEVRASNTRAIELYMKKGFNQLGVRKQYYPAGQKREDALVMARELLGEDPF